MNRKAEHLTVKCSREIASYVLNDKRDNLLSLEQAYGISIFIVPSDEVKGSQALIEKAGERNIVIRKPAAAPIKVDTVDDVEEDDIEDVTDSEAEAEDAPAEASGDAENGDEESGDGQRGKRRRRGRRGGRRGGRDRDETSEAMSESDANDGVETQPAVDAETAHEENSDEAPAQAAEAVTSERGPSRRRDRWGRNRNGRNKNVRGDAQAESNGHTESTVAVEAAEPVAERPVKVRHMEPVIAVIEVVSQPVEVRKWQPPTQTVSVEEVTKKPKAGWWSKRS